MAEETTAASVRKNTLTRRTFRFLKWFAIVFVVFSIISTILLRFVPPPVTPLMMIRVVEAIAENRTPRIDKHWDSLDEISPAMTLAVIASEDNNFESHFGIDFKAIQKANKLNQKGKKMRGASTITQQTAKNVFLWPARTWLRKGVELYFTGLIELVWSKKRIMELYLNVIEMGDGIYGVERAANVYFHKSAANLNRSEAAAIAAVLPNPRKWRPDRPTPYIQKKIRWTLSMMNKVDRPDW
jgi:monofunctional biosynthetic peptidoglycan transglycosylase